jgi:hypothetical protein
MRPSNNGLIYDDWEKKHQENLMRIRSDKEGQ